TLRLLGVGPGDEVLVPAYTYTASASVVCHVGARPVFVDSQPDSYEMDYDALSAAVTRRTKAVIPVDIGGVVCDYPRLFAALADTAGSFTPGNDLQAALGRPAVLADGAHSFGSLRGGVPSGSFGDFTAFSFHAVKSLTTGEGGAIVWKPIPGMDDDELYRQYMLLSLHGQSKDALAKLAPGAWEYDIVMPGYKCNMPDILAALGLAQLTRYEEMLRHRRKIVALYQDALAGRDVGWLAHLSDASLTNAHLFMAQLNGRTLAQRNALIHRLAQRGIAANVHFKPLPMMTAYRNLGADIGDYPHARRLFEREITLPLYSTLSQNDAQYVAQNVIELLEEV
ncbi:MAG: DegT/DnrJ/EryC1/StrS family aminotransferase, partial [Eubacteriales bacterium]|nr:DegT/DnrJ/EryC1/StrS family aminotransferase [Eubacteriales bacterium]